MAASGPIINSLEYIGNLKINIEKRWEEKLEIKKNIYTRNILNYSITFSFDWSMVCLLHRGIYSLHDTEFYSILFDSVQKNVYFKQTYIFV